MNISIDGSAEMVNLLVWVAVLGLAGYLIYAVFKSIIWVIAAVLIIGLLVPGAISWNKLADNPLGALASGQVAAAGQNTANAGSGAGSGNQEAGNAGAGAGAGTGNAAAQPAPDGMAVLLNTIMATMTTVTDWIVAWGLDAFNRYMTPQVEFPAGGGGGGGTGGAGGGGDGGERSEGTNSDGGNGG